MTDELREDRIIYTDGEGNACDLVEMCRRIPTWAAERLCLLSEQLAAMTVERDRALDQVERVRLALRSPEEEG